MKQRQRQRNRRGVAVVEMALILPVFLMVVLGILEFGRAMMVSNLLTTAARDAGRLAIMKGNSNSDVEQSIHDFLETSLGLSPGEMSVNISVTPAPGNDNPGNEVANAQLGDVCTIAVEVPFDEVSLIPGSYLDDVSLHGDCILHHQ